jgi:hypothetical protein
MRSRGSTQALGCDYRRVAPPEPPAITASVTAPPDPRTLRPGKRGAQPAALSS